MKSLFIIQISQIFAEKCRTVENYVECTNIENTDRNIIYEENICNYFVINSTSLTELHFDSFEKINHEKCESGNRVLELLVLLKKWKTTQKSENFILANVAEVIFERLIIGQLSGFWSWQWKYFRSWGALPLARALRFWNFEAARQLQQQRKKRSNSRFWTN